jgi:asparagine synthetase B (glutamine-hydrolysing)
MCGIAGEFDWDGAGPTPGVIAAMIDSLAHRGPEGNTCWFSPDGKLALAVFVATALPVSTPICAASR